MIKPHENSTTLVQITNSSRCLFARVENFFGFCEEFKLIQFYISMLWTSRRVAIVECEIKCSGVGWKISILPSSGAIKTRNTSDHTVFIRFRRTEENYSPEIHCKQFSPFHFFFHPKQLNTQWKNRWIVNCTKREKKSWIWFWNEGKK